MAMGVRGIDTVSLGANCIFFSSFHSFVHHFMEAREKVVKKNEWKEGTISKISLLRHFLLHATDVD